MLAEAGLLSPLEDAYKNNGWKIFDWAKQRATYGGTVYGVPSQVEEIIVYFNKDLVPEAPKTVEDLRAIADEVKGHATYTYRSAFNHNLAGYGSAVAMLITLLSFVAAISFVYLRERQR